jgi:DNA-binding winged helix-turn-helix (wHTH) protein
MDQQLDPAATDEIKFGPFRLSPRERLLTKDGAPINLGGRAFDILIALIKRPGEIISKKELLAQVWPDVNVDDGSLRFNIGALRKMLGDGRDGARYVTNVPGRGYCFVAPVSQGPVAKPSVVQPRSSRLPSPLRRMIGRDPAVRTIADHLRTDRFVTIVGAGGIGKTTVAVSVGHAMLQ